MNNKELIHLNNAGQSPVTEQAQQAIAELLSVMRTQGAHCGSEIFEPYNRARETFAKLVNCKTEHLVFMQTCASAISQVALGLTYKPGEKIIITDQEYASNAYPWYMAAKRDGADVVVVKSNQDFSIPIERILDLIDEKTRVVAFSWVQCSTGWQIDPKPIVARCKEVDALCVVDAIQGLGIVPFDMQELGVDAVCGGNHKWLRGTLGHGFLGLQPELADKLTPLSYGAVSFGEWLELAEPNKPLKSSPDRYEPGCPHLLGAVGGAASIDLLLELGIEQLNKDAVATSEYLKGELHSRGCYVYPAPELSVRGVRWSSPITSFKPSGDLKSVCNSLDNAGISYSCRFDTFIRIAPHYFNTTEEIDKVLECLE